MLRNANAVTTVTLDYHIRSAQFYLSKNLL